MAISRQIPSYDHAKHTILNAELMKEGPALHVISSMIAGFMTALTTSPVDVIKTRIMNQKSHGELCRLCFIYDLSLYFTWHGYTFGKLYEINITSNRIQLLIKLHDMCIYFKWSGCPLGNKKINTCAGGDSTYRFSRINKFLLLISNYKKT